MKIKVINWRYIPSSGASLKQGVKRGYKPHNTIRGGYGSYIVNDPPQVEATMEDDAGNRETPNIYIALKRRLRDAGVDRVTEKRVNTAMKYYQSLGLFEADEWYDLPALPYGLI